MREIARRIREKARNTVTGVPEGADAVLIAALARERPERDLLAVMRDAERARRLGAALAFFAPELRVLSFPAWDCLPYDRVSPNPSLAGRRLAVLGDLCQEGRGPALVLTTAGALLQRLPAPASLRPLRRRLAPGETVDGEALLRSLVEMGYTVAGTVMEAGEVARRGDILDVFPAGGGEPLRIDFFGDEIEGIRAFDPLSQRSSGRRDAAILDPASEALLDAASVARFRSGWRENFGIQAGDDPLYRAVAAGGRHPGMEHWLALFHERLEPLTAYLRDAAAVLDHRLTEARDARLETVRDHFRHREETGRNEDGEALPYRPLPPERLYLGELAWEGLFAGRTLVELSPFTEPGGGGRQTLSAGARQGHDFVAERHQGSGLFDAAARHLEALAGERAGEGLEVRRRVAVTAATVASRNRLARLLGEHGVRRVEPVANGEGMASLAPGCVAAAVLDLEHGFVTDEIAVVSERDIVGDGIRRGARRSRRRGAERFVAEASQLAPGDLVVHAEHGIGRFDGLQTLVRDGAPHDCLRLLYAGGDKLFVLVENVEMLSRYGSHDSAVQLDRLGSASWQARRARLKERITAMAGELLKVAAWRRMRPGPVMRVPDGAFAEFCARFPFDETDDQDRAIAEVLEDLAAGRAMDRLVCGDVGFGKTEVALRAAFVAVMAGFQVALVAPTTLLARQHFATFRERFEDFGAEVAQLSRFVGAREARRVKAGLESGAIDIVIGTHALLARDVEVKRLGLLIVDEEQHFGVAHKERLKRLKADVHVLTLTATPIPRTLQMSLAGVKDMSPIATAPVDRLAVRTFVSPFDSVTLREALRRELLRGGQSYVVCPRIADLERLAKLLQGLVPEARFAIAHGRMAGSDLERIMAAFYDGEIDVLVSTAIVESGLDIPNVNTMVVYRADLFGLAQLYQLRGRVGRARRRAYAWLTLPPGRKLTPAAGRRLQVLSRLDSLGAGFSLASHDLDIRGAGNLLGAEQSGHIREVGVELYQQMLNEAVQALRAEGQARAAGGGWVPEISIGTAVLIPEDYVRDLDVRLGLYRRIAALEEAGEIDDLRQELEDRFGAPPGEVDNLLAIVAIKAACRRAGIARIDAGPGGASIAFRDAGFANPAGLVDWIGGQGGRVRLRPDQRLIVGGDWKDVGERLDGARHLAATLAAIGEAA